ncbi:MAG: tetratricopeptide repeat protein [Kovacikia sp.]
MNTRMFPGRYNRTLEGYRSTRSGARLDEDSQKPPARKKQALFGGPATRDLSLLSQAEQDRLLRKQALDNAQQGKAGQALALLNQLIDRNPTNASDFNNRGLLHFRKGQFVKALADYDKALQLNPQLAKVYNNRANCYAALGQLAEAIVDYEMAIDLDPANIRAWINQGITFRDLEMYSQASENFDLALQLSQIFQGSDDNEIPTFLEGHIYAERGRTHHLAGDWNYAVADYQRALIELPQVNLLDTTLSHRLRLKVETWLNDLLQPLFKGTWDGDEEL